MLSLYLCIFINFNFHVLPARLITLALLEVTWQINLLCTMTQFNLIGLNVSMLSFLPKDELLLRTDSSPPVQNILKGNQVFRSFWISLIGFNFFLWAPAQIILFLYNVLECQSPWSGCSVNYNCYKISVACYLKRDPVLHTTRVQKQGMKLEMMWKQIHILSEWLIQQMLLTVQYIPQLHWIQRILLRINIISSSRISKFTTQWPSLTGNPSIQLDLSITLTLCGCFKDIAS